MYGNGVWCIGQGVPIFENFTSHFQRQSELLMQNDFCGPAVMITAYFCLLFALSYTLCNWQPLNIGYKKKERKKDKKCHQQFDGAWYVCVQMDVVEARQDVRDSSRSWLACSGRTNGVCFSISTVLMVWSQCQSQHSQILHQVHNLCPDQVPFGSLSLKWSLQMWGCLSPSEIQTQEKQCNCFSLSTTLSCFGRLV